jgi:sRNA-binding carbon storage regulator CsrA
MLIFTQKPGQRAILTLPDGSKIEVVIVRVEGNKVQVGDTAATNVCIDREAVHLRKIREAALAEVAGNVA